MTMSQAVFLGAAGPNVPGAQTVSFAVDTDLNLRKGRLVRALATASSKKLRLPAAADLLHGQGHAWILSQGSQAFDLCDSAGTVLKNLPVGKAAIVSLLTAGTPGTWAVSRHTIG